MKSYLDPEEYIVTTITIAAPVGPATHGGPNIVTINYGSNSTASQSVTISATDDEVAALDAAWMELWGNAQAVTNT